MDVLNLSLLLLVLNRIFLLLYCQPMVHVSRQNKTVIPADAKHAKGVQLTDYTAAVSQIVENDNVKRLLLKSALLKVTLS